MKTINEYNGYLVSEDGKVYSEKYGYRKELKQFEHKGYRRVALSKNNKRRMFPVHRLVADAFLPNPKNKPYVNHLDGNKRNNHWSNLEWCTRAENQEHSREILGNTGIGSKNSHYGYRNAKLYPNEELRNRLVELGIPRYKHNLAELGEMLPHRNGHNIDVGYFESAKGIANWRVYWTDQKTGQWIKDYEAQTEADARAKMLIYLIENKLIDVTSLRKEE